MFTSCRDIQRNQGVRMDGEYYLKVKFRTLQVRLCWQKSSCARHGSRLMICLALDLLCWDADQFPEGVRDTAQQSDRQLFWGVRTQVCNVAMSFKILFYEIDPNGFCPSQTGWSTPSNVRTMAVAGRTVSAEMTIWQQGTRSSTKFVWTWTPFG